MNGDKLERLERLKRLLDSGVLSQPEYEMEKEIIMRGVPYYPPNVPPQNFQPNPKENKGSSGWKVWVGIGAAIAIGLFILFLTSNPANITVKVRCNGCEASYTKQDNEPVEKYNIKGVWEKKIWCEKGSVVTIVARNVNSSDKISVHVYLNGDLIDSDYSSGEGALVGAFGHVPKD